MSAGCDGCYARVQSERLKRFGQEKYAHGFLPRTWPDHLEQPLHWKKPAVVFVNSMSDLFHNAFPADYIASVWDVMLRADQHVYQVLTKRPHRMERIIRDRGLELPPHIWLGTSTEEQVFVDNRLPPLLRLAPAVAFASAEPLLGPLNFSRYLGTRRGRLHWVIDGGESGRTAATRRPARHEWFRSIRDQCARAGVPYFHKQGNHHLPGRDRVLDGVTHDALPELRSLEPESREPENREPAPA